MRGIGGSLRQVRVCDSTLRQRWHSGSVGRWLCCLFVPFPAVCGRGDHIDAGGSSHAGSLREKREDVAACLVVMAYKPWARGDGQVGYYQAQYL